MRLLRLCGLVLFGLLTGCGAKAPPRAPGASAPPEALVQPAGPDCDDCIVTQPQPGLVPAPAPADADPIAPEAVPRADEPEADEPPR